MKSVRRFLQKSEAVEKLPIERGVINRAAVARRFHIPYAATRVEPLKSIIDKFNARISERGSVASKYDLEVAKVRQYLEQSFAEGSIPVRGTKVYRTAIVSKFGISATALKRHHGLKSLLEEFDNAISESELKGSKYDSYTEPLRALVRDCLSGKNPVPLYQGRMNRAVVARQLGVRIQALTLSSKLSEILAAADRELAAREDPFPRVDTNGRIYLFRPSLAPWISRHKRAYDFSELADIYSYDLAVRVRDAFLIYCSKLRSGTAKTAYRATLEALRFLAESDVAGPEIVAALSRATLPDRDVFEQACHAWRTERVSDLEGRKETTASAWIKSVNRALRYLVLAGIVPRISRLKPISGAWRKSKPRKSFAESSRQRMRQVAQDALRRIAEDREIEISASEENEFLHALEEEAARRDDLPDDTVSAIRVILAERLTAIRSCAECDFLKWERFWSEGQAILSEACPQSSKLVRLGGLSDSPEDVIGSIDFGDLLALVDRQWNGCAPRRNPHRKGVIHRFYRRHGGFYAVEHRLNPHPDAVVAALVMYLHDSGANTATARTLEIDCLEPSQLPGHERVTGFKARSKGKPIFTDLAVKNPEYQITTVMALRKLTEMTARYRRNAAVEDRKALFLVRPQSKVVALSDHRLTDWFKRFCERHDELRGVGYLLSMIRPSVLLDLALRKDGSLIAAQYKGQHASGSTTGRYVNKYPMLLLYEEKMKFFMNQFQATAIAPVLGAAQRLGISSDVAQELLEKAERNGLGVLCLLPRAGIQPGTSKGDLCHLPERCITCVASIVVPEPETISVTCPHQIIDPVVQRRVGRRNPRRSPPGSCPASVRSTPRGVIIDRQVVVSHCDGRRMLLSIHCDSARRGGGISERRGIAADGGDGRHR
jgi:hypothetical protein